MRFLMGGNYDEMSRKAAMLISAQVILKPDCVLGLATGSTPIGMYKNLIEANKKGDLDFSGVKTFNLDEYEGLAPDNDQSYAYFMRTNLFDHINIKPENTHIPNGICKDPVAESAAYEKLIKEHGGVDLQLMGIGNNGHVGFVEPSGELPMDTYLVDLAAATIDANSRFFKSIDDVPKRAFTMGLRTIMSAKKLLILASGPKNAPILYKLATGPATPELPASVLKLHPDFTVLGDKEALSEILEKCPELID